MANDHDDHDDDGTAEEKVRAALADPELKRALDELRAATPAGEPLFGAPLRTRDARAEVPAAEEVAVEDGAALVAQREAAAAYVEDAAPSTGRAPRMPTSKVRLSAEVVASDTRRQVTRPSIRRVEAAAVAAPGAEDVLHVEDVPQVAEVLPVAEASRVVDVSRVATEGSVQRSAPSVSPRARPARRAERSRRKVVAMGAVIGFVFVAVVGVGVAITGRRGGEHAGTEGAPLRASAENVQGASAGSCSGAGREPCPTVMVSAPPVVASAKSAAPSSSASGGATASSVKTTAGATANAAGTPADDVYADAATASATPRGTSAPSGTVAPTSSSAPTAPATTMPKPGPTLWFGEQ